MNIAATEVSKRVIKLPFGQMAATTASKQKGKSHCWVERSGLVSSSIDKQLVDVFVLGIIIVAA
ncbi:hypothetical protein SLEP1_g33380 [Rubroshorea leprosula]|uniref:Uncharacterized protein n=1 Tax=Rubroshorea leprosula TaxID=152421 RepID=A0AAV5KGE5_9ROSI|nr:hypothetical protein SLEP1_g33380 [Rubroshorea leprosula]